VAKRRYRRNVHSFELRKDACNLWNLFSDIIEKYRPDYHTMTKPEIKKSLDQFMSELKEEVDKCFYECVRD